MATMFVDEARVPSGSKQYVRYLLRESYREGGKVKHRTIANISHCSKEEIEAIRLALKHKKNLAVLGNATTDIIQRQGLSVGACWTLFALAHRLGICDALGSDRQGKLALWQVIARVIDQGSRLSAVRLARVHAACDVLDLGKFDEDNLYDNLGWLDENQADIEDALFRKAYGPSKHKPELFLYDVTSSYLEGQQNELAAFGYNRDGKRGKMQIVIGLLTNEDGVPLSVEVFDGNTSDPKTMYSQIRKVAERFGGERVTFVGDRGMIKGPQIKDIKANGMHYITAITKPQIETLLKKRVVQMEMFDENLAEVVTREGIRYILRRNPTRAMECAATRQSKLDAVQAQVDEANEYLSTHAKAAVATAARRVEQSLARYKLTGWVCVCLEGARRLNLQIDEDARLEDSKLDGCYVVTTDLAREAASMELVHRRYKDLSQVEQAFRTSKTVQLEMHPIYVRRGDHTRGHVFVVMLAYLLVMELQKLWNGIDLTVEEGIKALSGLHAIETTFRGKPPVNVIPQPDDTLAQLLHAAQVALPGAIPSRGIVVATKKKLASERKTLDK